MINQTKQQTTLTPIAVLITTLLVGSLPVFAAGPDQTTPGMWDGHTVTTWVSPRFGFRISVPNAGYLIGLESAPADVSPRVPLETVLFLTQGDEHLRIESWPNPDHWSVAEWVDRDMRFLDHAESQWFPVFAGRERHAAIRLKQTKSPQSLARTTVFVATDGLLLRISCNDSANVFAHALLEAVVTSLVVPSGGKP